MPKKRKNIASVGYFKVRTLAGSKGDTFQADLRSETHTLPDGVKVRQTKKIFKEAADICQHWTEQLKQHGKSAEDYWSSFSSEERIRTGQLMEAALKDYPDLRLDQIVKSGIKVEVEELNNESFPALKKYIEEEYLPYRKDGKSLGRQTEKKRGQEYSEIRLALRPIAEDKTLGHMRLNVAFKPKSHTFRKITAILNSLTKAVGKNKIEKPIVINQKKKKAGHIHRMFKRALKDYPDIEGRIPTDGLAKEFEDSSFHTPAIIRSEKVRELFKAAINPPRRTRKWTDQIPFMALLFFSGCRPEEIAGEHGEGHRVLHWENMRGWKDKCEKSGGLIITVPAVDSETGKATAKSNFTTDRILFPQGVAWMKWYFLTHKGLPALPTSGTYDDGSHTVWRNIRDRCGVGGEDDDGVNLWNADCARHTVASSIHRLQMDERAYWTDMFGHSADMLQRAYKNPSVDKAQANEYLTEIQPPNVLNEREVAEAQAQAEHESDISEVITWQSVMEALEEKFGSDPLSRKRNRGVTCYYDQFKWAGEKYEMCDFYPKDYNPPDPSEDFPEVDAFLDSNEAQLDYAKRIEELTPEESEMLIKRNRWIERIGKARGGSI